MDEHNYRNILSLAKNKEEAKKVKMILNEINPQQNLSVPDPYYGGASGFEKVLDLLEDGCENLLQEI